MTDSNAPALLVRDVALPAERRLVSIRCQRGMIVEVGPGLRQQHGETTIDAQGGRLIPTLADSHLHVGAWLRAMRSTQFPAAGLNEELCRQIESDGPNAGGWIVLFGIDHQHDSLQEIAMLERCVKHPVLLIHRTGHAAFASRLGREQLARRGLSLREIGGCWRTALGPDTCEDAVWLAQLREILLAQGVSDIQDATPYPAHMADRAAWLSRLLSPIRVKFMGTPRDPLQQASHLKILDPLTQDVCQETDRPLAIHAIEPDEIDVACRAVGTTGRIEHAALCPEVLVEQIARTGCGVCANPGFFIDRATAIAPLIETGEANFYQPLASFLDAGICLLFGSDAPVGRPGPWSAIRGALHRGIGDVRFPGRRLTFDDALRCATLAPEMVGIGICGWLGRRADFAVLDCARDARLPAVASTIIDGKIAFDAIGRNEQVQRL